MQPMIGRFPLRQIRVFLWLVAGILMLLATSGDAQNPAGPQRQMSAMARPKPAALTTAQKLSRARTFIGKEKAARLIKGTLQSKVKLSVRNGYVSRVAHLFFDGDGLIDYRANVGRQQTGSWHLSVGAEFVPSKPGAYLVDITLDIDPPPTVPGLTIRPFVFYHVAYRSGTNRTQELESIRVQRTDKHLTFVLETEESAPLRFWVRAGESGLNWSFHECEISLIE